VLFWLLNFGRQKQRFRSFAFQNSKAKKNTYLGAFGGFCQSQNQKKPQQTPPHTLITRIPATAPHVHQPAPSHAQQPGLASHAK
jgi:hypothetical protein